MYVNDNVFIIKNESGNLSVKLKNNWSYAHIRNDGDSIAYVSLNANANVTDSKGVLSIPAQTSAYLSLINNNFFVIGKADLQVVVSNSYISPFKSVSKGGGEIVLDEILSPMKTPVLLEDVIIDLDKNLSDYKFLQVCYWINDPNIDNWSNNWRIGYDYSVVVLDYNYRPRIGINLPQIYLDFKSNDFAQNQIKILRSSYSNRYLGIYGIK